MANRTHLSEAELAALDLLIAVARENPNESISVPNLPRATPVAVVTLVLRAAVVVTPTLFRLTVELTKGKGGLAIAPEILNSLGEEGAQTLTLDELLALRKQAVDS